MQLDRLAVQLRLRNSWEAMDLGFAMTRTWMPRVYGAWFAVAVPMFALAAALLPAAGAVWVFWWCKPVLDRVVLHVLASGVFGELPPARSTLRALPRALTPGLLASLTWLRLAPARSFNLAVWQLERQRGRAAATRRRQLQRRVGGNAVWLTAVCMHFELALGLSIFALFDLLMPGTDSDGIGLFQMLYGATSDTTGWAFALTYFATVTLLEPAYAAAGFALYLNRRTALEGWDLEVALRRMGLRMAQGTAMPQRDPGAGEEPGTPAQHAGSTVASTAALLAFAIALCCGLQAAPGHAQSQAAVRDPAAEVKKVYERPELDPYEERTSLEWLGPKDSRERRARGPTWVDRLGSSAGELLRVLAWVALGLALAFLLFHLVRRLGLLARTQARNAQPPPSTLFGLDVRPETLPADPAGAALQLAREGRILQALSLLYRGALSTLLHRDGTQLAGGDTEADCLEKSRGRLPEPGYRYFAQLLAAWQRAAYARREVPQAEVETLCRDWPLHFSAQEPVR